MSAHLRGEVIRLRLDERLPYRVIAKLLGVPRNKVRRWCSEAAVDPSSPPVRWLPDPRDTTGQVAGDPMPGRSALDQRRQA